MSKDLNQNLTTYTFSRAVNILTVLIHKLKAAWPTKISMPFLSFLDNLL